jgi:hypothetical protein
VGFLGFVEFVEFIGFGTLISIQPLSGSALLHNFALLLIVLEIQEAKALPDWPIQTGVDPPLCSQARGSIPKRCRGSKIREQSLFGFYPSSKANV